MATHSIEPLILSLETSGRLGSVAMAQAEGFPELLAESPLGAESPDTRDGCPKGGPQLLALHNFTGPMRHSAEVFPAIVDLLKKFGKKARDIEQVYISNGPGSFTGLRIAVTIAKTYALANQAQIVAVDTLDVIASNAIDKNIQRLAVILDAKRGQFFIAVYEKMKDGWQKLISDSLLTDNEFLERFTDKPVALTGEGLVFYKDKFAHKNVCFLDEKFWYPSAEGVHKLGLELAKQGQFADPLTLTPNYLRAPL